MKDPPLTPTTSPRTSSAALLPRTVPCRSGGAADDSSAPTADRLTASSRLATEARVTAAASAPGNPSAEGTTTAAIAAAPPSRHTTASRRIGTRPANRGRTTRFPIPAATDRAA
jgi:hypothetical protein